MSTHTFSKTLNVYGVSVPVDHTIVYSPDVPVPDSIILKKHQVEEEIYKFLCWKQFLFSKESCPKIKSYFARLAKEHSKDLILHRSN